MVSRQLTWRVANCLTGGGLELSINPFGSDTMLAARSKPISTSRSFDVPMASKTAGDISTGSVATVWAARVCTVVTAHTLATRCTPAWF